MAAGGRKTADNALAVALASGMTVAAAAHVAGVSERTAHRRLADAAFARRVTEIRGEMVSRAVGRMTRGMTAAANTLLALLEAADERVRLGAAKAVLELGVKLREATELEARLLALEEQSPGNGKARAA